MGPKQVIGIQIVCIGWGAARVVRRKTQPVKIIPHRDYRRKIVIAVELVRGRNMPGPSKIFFDALLDPVQWVSGLAIQPGSKFRKDRIRYIGHAILGVGLLYRIITLPKRDTGE
jgi:hypothetical protein